MLDLIATLRMDLADSEALLFSDATLERCLHRAIFPLSRDLDISLSLVDGEISPEPSGEVRELLLRLAQIHACQTMRIATANAFSFTSGDKKVDKTQQPGHWAKLEGDLRSAYQQRLQNIRPKNDATSSGCDYITPPDLAPVIFEQGSET